MAWSSFTVMEPLCCEVYGSAFIFGSRNGKVYQGFYGFRDDDSYDGTTNVGNEVTGRFQAAFSSFGVPTLNKRAQRVRVLGRCNGEPAVAVAIRNEYNIDQILSPPAPALAPNASWDVALWDLALWQATSSTFNRWIGVTGFGKMLALQCAVRGTGYTLITDYEITFLEGYGL
jgi:hypothetical protein